MGKKYKHTNTSKIFVDELDEDYAYNGSPQSSSDDKTLPPEKSSTHFSFYEFKDEFDIRLERFEAESQKRKEQEETAQMAQEEQEQRDRENPVPRLTLATLQTHNAQYQSTLPQVAESNLKYSPSSISSDSISSNAKLEKFIAQAEEMAKEQQKIETKLNEKRERLKQNTESNSAHQESEQPSSSSSSSSCLQFFSRLFCRE